MQRYAQHTVDDEVVAEGEAVDGALEEDAPGDFVSVKRVRGRTQSIKRLSKKELFYGTRIANAELEGMNERDLHRPTTRAECEPGGRNEMRPCPYVSCVHHLYLDVSPRSGAIKVNFPDREVWEMDETCAHDVAKRGGVTLEEVGAIMNLTRERIRQLETRGVAKLKGAADRGAASLQEWADELSEGAAHQHRRSLSSHAASRPAASRALANVMPYTVGNPNPNALLQRVRVQEGDAGRPEQSQRFQSQVRAELSAALAAKQVKLVYSRPLSERDAEDPRVTMRKLHSLARSGVAKLHRNNTDELFPKNMVWPEDSPNRSENRLGPKQRDAERIVAGLDGQIAHHGAVASMRQPTAHGLAEPYSRHHTNEVREALHDARLHGLTESLVCDGTEVEDEVGELPLEVLDEVRAFGKDDDDGEDDAFAFEQGEDPEAPPGY